MAPMIEPTSPGRSEAQVLRRRSEERIGEEPADERSDDAEEDGGADAHAVVAGDNRVLPRTRR